VFLFSYQSKIDFIPTIFCPSFILTTPTDLCASSEPCSSTSVA
jgi:hypothetical protein